MPPVKATARQLGASTKRLKPILDLVRGKRVDEALDTLRFLSSPWAAAVAKVVQSAAANAENNLFMDRDNLRITSVVADPGRSIKRFRPRARGRMGRITKRSSHVTVVVDEEAIIGT